MYINYSLTYSTYCFNFTTYYILNVEANASSRHNDSVKHIKFCVLPSVPNKSCSTQYVVIEPYKRYLVSRTNKSYISFNIFSCHIKCEVKSNVGSFTARICRGILQAEQDFYLVLCFILIFLVLWLYADM